MNHMSAVQSERQPMLRGKHTDADMVLPAGKTCADCAHFRRCNAMFGHIAADEVCDWAPSRFRQIPAEWGIAKRLDELMRAHREDGREISYADLLAVKGMP
jgi:hypothetical protein